MKPDNELSQLLKQWRGIEPSADFNERVWARIEKTNNIIPFPRQQILAVAASIFLSLGIGLSMGLVRNDHPTAPATLGTISGNYARLVQGGAR
jgi:hypothetical protein